MKPFHIPANHHAFVISLDGRVALEVALAHLEENLASTFASETLVTRGFHEDSFTIKLARQVKTAQENKNLPSERRILLISFTSITREAQNALLKVLEEPTPGTHIFLIVPHSEVLLSTVRSRVIQIQLVEDKASESVESFLTKPYADRLKLVAKFLEDKSLVATFFSNLEHEIARIPRNKMGLLKNNYTKIVDYKRRALSGSTVTKYLLEELALTLPIL